MMIRFEWDEEKNLVNQKKHHLSFETASLVFDDPLHRSIFDQIVDREERWKTICLVQGLAMVVVAHTYREDDGEIVIRIISARRTTRHERRKYEEETG